MAEYRLSRSEKKRRAKNIEMLALELIALSRTDIKKLACDDFIKGEILTAQPLKAGARKRQVKYLTKQLREEDTDPLFNFLAEKKGSHLKQTHSFHELERFRDDIIDDALLAKEKAWRDQLTPDENWPSITLEEIGNRFPNIDIDTIRKAATAFARSHKKSHSREVFRILKAAADQEELAKKVTK